MHPFLMIALTSFLLSACQGFKEAAEADELEAPMDPGVRQVLMEEEAEYPQQEEGMIYAPSEMIGLDEDAIR
jgi:hypothetical protein